MAGKWMDLFDNLAAVINGQKELFMDLSDVVVQLEIIEAILSS